MMRDADSTMLDCHDLEVRRGGNVVLSVPHMVVHRAETLAVIGPNGAGKSTLLLALALLFPVTAGRICVAGEVANPANALRLRRRMAVVFQEPLLLDTTVAENVATGLMLRGVAGAERERRVATWLERFGIGHLARRSARSLSGGEAQRTSLARACALEPEVLFLDEPFSALDAPTRAAVTADLAAVLHSTKITTVLVTHDRDEALSLGSRVGVLIGGRLRQLGRPDDVFGRPVDTDVAAFVGIDTVVPGEVVAQEDGVAQVSVAGRLAEVVAPFGPGTPVYLTLRAEDVTLHPAWRQGDDLAQSSARNKLSGRVAAVDQWGGQVRVAVDCGFRLTAALTRRSLTELGLVEGAPVVASFKASAAHLIHRADLHGILQR